MRQKAIHFKNYIKFYHYTTSVGLFSTFLFILLTLLIITPLDRSSEKGLAASGDTSTTSLTLATSGSAELDLLVTDDSGTFASNGAPLTFHVSTNNYTGYTVSIRAKSGTELTNIATDGNNNTINNTFTSISGSGITSETFDTSTYNGMWGIKPNYYLSEENTENKFYPSPDASGITLNRTDCANNTALSDNALCKEASNTYSISIAARATYAQAAGTYTNTYILSAVGNYPEYKITYNLNGGETDSDDLTDGQSATSDTNDKTSINFTKDEPTRDGYEFIGWCDIDNTADPTSCSGNTYESGDKYALDLLSFNTKPLYAIWKSTAVKVYMQDMTYAQCPSDTATVVYDNRDETPYVVQRLADGKCWMLENLAFDVVAHIDDITATNTNIDSANATNILTSLKSGNRSAGDQYATGGAAYNNSSNYSAPSVSVSGTCDSTSYCTNNPSGQWKSTDTVKWGAGVSSITIDGQSVAQGKVGVYYNFCAASAGSYCYSLNASVGNASSDICPYGWSIPTGDYDGEFRTLYTQYGNSTTKYVTALRLPLSGYSLDGKAYDQGKEGHWWGSTRNGVNAMQGLSVSASQVDTVYNNGRGWSSSVRCVMSISPNTVKYMQDITADDIDNMAELESTLLHDRRDNNDYTVKKINGLLWMTQNLRITGTISSTDSNFTRVSSFNVSENNLADVSSSSSPCYGYVGFRDDAEGYGWSSACRHGSSRTNGAWYNYYAATAGQIGYTDNNVSATQDICPANWHLPTGPSTTNNTEYNKLVGNTVSGWQGSTVGLTAFGAVAGGTYFNGFLNSETYGYWWSATASSNRSRYVLSYGSSDGQFRGDSSDYRYHGFFVRCVRSS